jgi:hypothetical protein
VGSKVTVAKIAPTVKVKVLKSGKLQVTVKAKGIAKPAGKITVKVGKKTVATWTLKAKGKGKLSKALPAKVKAGSYKVKVTFKGSKAVAKKTSKAVKVTVKK